MATARRRAAASVQWLIKCSVAALSASIDVMPPPTAYF